MGLGGGVRGVAAAAPAPDRQAHAVSLLLPVPAKMLSAMQSFDLEVIAQFGHTNPTRPQNRGLSPNYLRCRSAAMVQSYGWLCFCRFLLANTARFWCFSPGPVNISLSSCVLACYRHRFPGGCFSTGSHREIPGKSFRSLSNRLRQHMLYGKGDPIVLAGLGFGRTGSCFGASHV